VTVGNAARDGDAYRGWFVGHFVAADDGPRRTDQVEVKWGVHARGERRAAWAASADATTLSVVLRGAIRLFFQPGDEALLRQPGDYALWSPGIAHRWDIEDDETIVLTVRWPSKTGDATTVDGGHLTHG
jgi:quercetin dioxygenase-like cupin family protein